MSFSCLNTEIKFAAVALFSDFSPKNGKQAHYTCSRVLPVPWMPKLLMEIDEAKEDARFRSNEDQIRARINKWLRYQVVLGAKPVESMNFHIISDSIHFNYVQWDVQLANTHSG